MELRELVETSNMADIVMIKSLLESEDIPYLAQGDNLQLLRPLIEPVRFLVAEEDLERARPLIDSLRLSYGPIADLDDREGQQSNDA